MEEPQDPQVRNLDARSLRGLAHPLRMQLLDALRFGGPATASQLAEKLGESSGATSYHLRQLAEAGLVVEDDSRGNARDRWWKAAHQTTSFDLPELLDQEPELTLGFLHGVGQAYAENMFAFIDSMQTLDPEWKEASLLSDYHFHLRADQLAALRQELAAVLAKYATPDLTAPLANGEEQVTIQIQAFPRETR